jgi:serine/threonine protein kinase
MAPEQARGEVTAPRADIYAAGVVLWECLAGKLPAPSLPAVKLVGLKSRSPQSFFQKTPSESSPAIDNDLQNIILVATAAEKKDRYADCGQFLDDLNKYAAARC